MSNELDKAMSPLVDATQVLADRVAETLQMFLPYFPISPSKGEITHNVKMSRLKEEDREEYDITKEKDISMSTNIPRGLALVVGYEKALGVTDPCEARTAFMEQTLRALRSVKGWNTDKTIEAMKAVRPIGEQEKEKGRVGRFLDWFRNR